MGYHGLYVKANRDIKKGEEIFWHYGRKGNQAFLTRMGFTLADDEQTKSYTFGLVLKNQKGA